MVEEAEVHGRHAGEDRDPVALDDLQHLGGVEAGNQGDGAAGKEGRVHDAALAEGVEEWKNGQRHLVVLVGHQAGAADLTAHVEVEVAELGALGAARGARGVQDHGGVLGRGGPHLWAWRALQELAEVACAFGQRVPTWPQRNVGGEPEPPGALQGFAGEVLPGDRNFASESLRWNSTSGALRRTFIGTTTPPALRMPK